MDLDSPDPPERAVVADVQACLRDWIAGRRVIVAGIWGDVRRWSDSLKQLGAADVLMITASSPGFGNHGRSDQRIVAVDVDSADGIDVMDSIERSLSAGDPRLAAAVEAFDPNRRAMVLGSQYTAESTIFGRQVCGGRLPSWASIESKLTIDGMFDELGLAHPPVQKVAMRGPEQSLLRAIASADQGDGVIAAFDGAGGVDGGASRLRWIRDGDRGLSEALARFAASAEAIRLQPFVVGVPCCIQGICLESGVFVFRPVEVLMAEDRRTDGVLRYLGPSTHWEPDADVRRQIEGAGRAVGNWLRAKVAYRGAFTVDGILGPDGFVCTEVNTRFGAGLDLVNFSLPEIPLYLLSRAIIDSAAAGLDWSVIESMVVRAAAASRLGYLRLIEPRLADRTAIESNSWRWAAGGELRPAALDSADVWLGQDQSTGHAAILGRVIRAPDELPLSRHLPAMFRVVRGIHGNDGMSSLAPVPLGLAAEGWSTTPAHATRGPIDAQGTSAHG